MLGNSLLNKLWNIISGCIVSLMQYCTLPVGNNVGKAQEMYSSVLNLLTGV